MGTDGLSSTRWACVAPSRFGDGLSASFGPKAPSAATAAASVRPTPTTSPPVATGLFGRRATVSLSGNFGEVRSAATHAGVQQPVRLQPGWHQRHRQRWRHVLPDLPARRTFASNGISYFTPGGLGGCTRTSHMRLAKIRPTGWSLRHRAHRLQTGACCTSPLAPRVPTIWLATRRKPPQVRAMTSAWHVSMRSTA